MAAQETIAHPPVSRAWDAPQPPSQERFARAVTALARRNETLEEFAALVAHELKAPLLAALATEEPAGCVRRALELIDALLEVGREAPDACTASTAACLDGALRDISPYSISADADLPATLPLPATVLRLLLRNLLRNAVAAGAGSVHIAATRRQGTWVLEVHDDGVGLASDAGYREGSGLGLRLCRGIATRYGGSLFLSPSPAGGTQANLEFRSAA